MSYLPKELKLKDWVNKYSFYTLFIHVLNIYRMFKKKLLNSFYSETTKRQSSSSVECPVIKHTRLEASENSSKTENGQLHSHETVLQR